MTIYKNTYHGHGLESHGYSYHSSQRAARSAAAHAVRNSRDNLEPIADVQTERLEVRPTRAGIIAALNQHGGHNNNG